MCRCSGFWVVLFGVVAVVRSGRRYYGRRHREVIASAVVRRVYIVSDGRDAAADSESLVFLFALGIVSDRPLIDVVGLWRCLVIFGWLRIPDDISIFPGSTR